MELLDPCPLAFLWQSILRFSTKTIEKWQKSEDVARISYLN